MNLYVVISTVKKKKGFDYSAFEKALSSYHWEPCLPGSWFIASEKTAVQLFDHISKRITEEDDLVVLKLGHGAKWTAHSLSSSVLLLQRHTKGDL